MTDNDAEERMERRRRTVENMRRYGGSFVKALAGAYALADANNAARIESAFAEYITRYANWPQREPRG